MINFKKIPFNNTEEFNVLIEIPEGSINKYELDEVSGLMKLDFVFRDGLFLPFNYGSVAGTLAEDGDPLDAIVYSSKPLLSGTVVTVKPVGLFKMKDRGEQDNKILTVPIVDPLAKILNDVGDITEKQKNDITHFFQQVGIQKHKIVEIEGFFGKNKVSEEISKCLA
jgi:inorganic pyrophosphatase